MINQYQPVTGPLQAEDWPAAEQLLTERPADAVVVMVVDGGASDS